MIELTEDDPTEAELIQGWMDARAASGGVSVSGYWLPHRHRIRAVVLWIMRCKGTRHTRLTMLRGALRATAYYHSISFVGEIEFIDTKLRELEEE